MNRRSVLCLAVSLSSIGLAGCSGIQPDLRIRNYTGRTQTIRVQITGDERTVFSDRFEVTPRNGEDEQTRVDDVYPSKGVYEVSASVEEGPAKTEELRSGMTYININDDGLEFGRIAP